MSVYKVWSADRTTKKLVKASSLQQLKHNGAEKLGYSAADVVSVVVDYDGTVVEDDDYFSTLPKLTRFMLLRPGDTWSYAGRGGAHYDQPDAGTSDTSVAENTSDIVHILRQDITKIVTLTQSQLQTLTELEEEDLAHYLNIPLSESQRIKEKCQRYLDELHDSEEAMELIRLIKHNTPASQDSLDQSGSQDSLDQSGSQECSANTPDGSEQSEGPSQCKRSKPS